MTASLTALVGFAAWQTALTVLLGGYRTQLVLTGRKAANAFDPSGADVPGFGQRLTRARDNCYENLPVFAAFVLAAALAGRGDVTDPLAGWFLAARVGQSCVHLASTSIPAIQVRFAFYLAQLGILAWWAVRLVFG